MAALLSTSSVLDNIPTFSFWEYISGMVHRLLFVVGFSHPLWSLMFFSGAFFGTFLFYHILTNVFEVKNKKKKWLLTAVFLIVYFPLRDIAVSSIVPLPRILRDPTFYPSIMPRMSIRMFQSFWNNFHLGGAVLFICVVIKKVIDFCIKSIRSK